jgi:uncharacterized protein YjiK
MFFNYETQNRRKMKMLKITVLVAVVGLAAFFWSDIRGAVSSLVANNKFAKQTDATNTEVSSASGDVKVRNKWEMPAVLKEISGVSYLDANRFVCVQDPSGKIFIYNTAKSEIEKEIPFAGKGDYEGLTIVGENAWVLRADGTLFEVGNFRTKPVVREFDTHLTVKQNPEGLCYDQRNNRLLVAIKDEEPGQPDYKGIYGFDLGKLKMAETPVVKIDLNDERLTSTKKSKKKDNSIKPSAIGVHPVTGKIYITDGPGSKLLVMAMSGAIENLYQLDKKEFAQPEGLTFSPAGDLFISNEGSKAAGNIVGLEITK